MKRTKNILKRCMALIFAFIFAIGMINTSAVSVTAATAPGKPKISAEAGSNGSSITVNIGKTAGADGYKIMVKKPDSGKFVKLATVKKDGTAKRSFTAVKLNAGEYSFKVCAYKKSGKKTVFGKYSKVIRVTLGSKTTVISGDYTNLCGIYECAGNTIAIATDVPGVNNYGDHFEIIDSYVMACGAVRISETMYPDGFFYFDLVFSDENTLTAYTGPEDDHVVDVEFKVEGDTLYYTRTINADGYQEHLTFERIDGDPKKFYMDTAEAGSK